MSTLGFFFFFSSRRRHTRLVSDWSSDVCSSDLLQRTKKKIGIRDLEEHQNGTRELGSRSDAVDSLVASVDLIANLTTGVRRRVNVRVRVPVVEEHSQGIERNVCIVCVREAPMSDFAGQSGCRAIR